MEISATLGFKEIFFATTAISEKCYEHGYEGLAILKYQKLVELEILNKKMEGLKTV